MKKITLLLLAVLTMGAAAFAQNPQFTYRITYNSTTCVYEARVTLTGGAFNGTVGTRIPAASVFTIAVPAAYGDANFTINTLLPVGKTWTEGNGFRAPAANPAYDYHPVSISGGGAANAYPVMNVGDELILFTFTVSGNQCGAGMRPYLNGSDPSSAQYAAAGDAALLIDNAFQIAHSGAPLQTYTGNGTNATVPPSPAIASVTPACSPGPANGQVTVSLNTTATPGSACALPLSYAVTAPNGATGNSASSSFTGTKSALSGTYNVVVKDANGCPVSASQVYNVVCDPLPVTVASFTGTVKSCSAYLSLQTATEHNSKAYVLESSGDGKTYTAQSTVASRNSATGGTYSFGPYAMSAGANYYRVRTVDFDGSSSVTSVVSLRSTCGGVAGVYGLVPNPAHESVRVTGLSGGEQVTILDARGALLSVWDASAAGRSIDLSGYASGMYVVQIRAADGTTTQVKLIKN